MFIFTRFYAIANKVQDLLGHSTPKLTRRYAHLSPEVLRASVAVMDDVLGAAAGNGGNGCKMVSVGGLRLVKGV